MTWTAETSLGNEAGKIKWDLVEYTNGVGLDLGCGHSKAFPHFIGVDNGHHWGTAGADVAVKTCEDLSIFAGQSMDFVFSSHLLEHIQDTKAALKEWWRVLKVGGRLCLYLPHKDLYPNCGQPGSNPDHKHDFMPDDIEGIMKELGGWDMVRNETRAETNEYSFFQVYKKLASDKHRYSYREPKPAKTACVVRYGAFGDAIQTASVLPLLKAQGYHVTVYTTAVGHEVLKSDPHIDKFVLQANDQIPNKDLGEFWDNLATKFDKFVNYSESVERSLLAMPGSTVHKWPKSQRHNFLNHNYVEFMHSIAELPYKPAPKFYPTDDEKAWARKEKNKMGGQVILWSLAGSAVHKTWPHLDAAIARIMLRDKTTKVVLVGDELCQLLEAGWEAEPRVICRSGKWSIRESLAFAQVADLVIGSETGVLNAVGMDPVPKIVTLSHSSVQNLTRDWINCTSLEPKTSCYPCHQMHYNFDHCRRDDVTGVAQCQADITVDDMWSAIVGHLDKREAA